ncbi:MAG: hypothetical protein KBS98_06625, partial [Flavobacterium sp.]|nr:hypothetical protein [Candidatus Neoflavobacterium equi]
VWEKFTITTALFLLFLVTSNQYNLNAQVGVGTDNPLVTLHLKGNPENSIIADGVLPPTISKSELANKAHGTYSSTHEGTLIYVHLVDAISPVAPSENQVNKINTIGFYFFDGHEWIHLEKKTTEYEFVDNISHVASRAVNTNGRITQNLIVNNLNIGMSLPIVIPPKTQYKIYLNYSLPAGETSNNNNISGYLGIRFLKNGSELQLGSRKMAIPPQNSGVNARSVHIAASFIDEISNTTNQNMTVTYTLQGYIQPTTSSYLTTNYNVRFNMWTNSGYNYNWGYGNMNLQIYGKQL